MKGLFRTSICVVLVLTCGVAARGAESLFDPARHMRVAEVKPGMKGYGLSVFGGTKIERFEVEVISVLHNFNPKRDVILIRCSGANLEHTGAIAGMSGSPVYLTDEQNRSRLVGAFAYGWPLLKDPIAGVQPIEYMLELPQLKPESGDNGAIISGAPGAPTPRPKIRWNVFDAAPLPGMSRPPRKSPEAFETNPTKLQLLATPLMASGLPARVLERFAPTLSAHGLTPLQAGAAGVSNRDGDGDAAPLEPGSVLAAPLLTGDVELTAVGTVTEVIGDRVFGFGHPFNNEGPISLPMGSGEVNAILPSLAQSMKLGALTKLRGALVTDESVGVAGVIGEVPTTTPIELRVVYADGSQDETYRYNCAIHPRLTPMLAGIAAGASLSGRRDLPQYHTLEYDLNLEFANGAVVNLHDVAVNTAPEAWAAQAVLFPAMIAAMNPFERVNLRRVSGTVCVTPEAREAEVLSVNLPRLKYKPGDTVRAFVTYRPFRAAESILPIEVALPRDLPDGNYQLVVGDWGRYLSDEQMAQPFRFTTEGIDDVFAVLKDLMSLRHNALYVRLIRQADGVAVGRVAMPRLPASRRQVLLSSGRSNTTPFVSSTVQVVPTELLMRGAADLSIEIDSDEHVEKPTATAKPKLEHSPEKQLRTPTTAEQ